ncbi:MAG TPA: YidC/Oxa1 family membrane protein insertase [Patescibacteria group bacterium]|nr:YidC/Oxa1 family membrane protein insertase [Patescibacteria group bacterium]
MGNIFTILFVQPITNLLVVIYHALLFLHIPSPLGFAIILLTIIIRVALFPLMATQLKSSKKMQEVSPLLSKLREQYKGNPQRIQAETMALYKQYGINPAAGCLPLVVQLPVIWGLYSVLQQVVKLTSLPALNKLIYSDGMKLHHLWDTHFFGIPLGQSPSQLLATVGFLILVLPLLTAVSQFIQSKMMLPSTPPTPPQDKKKGSATDFASAFQTQSLYIFPLMIGFFSFRFPVGLSFYWITFTFFGIIQQYLMQRGTSSSVGALPIEVKITKKTSKARKKK